MASRIPTSLRRIATSWASQLTRLAKGFAPNHIKSAISSRVEPVGESKFIIRIAADRKIAPDARAQELGSGLHAKGYGKSEFITIRPKNRKVLAFNWEIANASPERFSFLPDGRVMLKEVHHPGIEAANAGQGYIRPAIKELKVRGRQELVREIRQAILGDIRTSFGRKE